MRRWLWLLGVVVVLATASPARAATVSSADGVITYQASPGWRDWMALFLGGAGAYEFSPIMSSSGEPAGGPGFAIDEGPGCSDYVLPNSMVHGAACPAAGVVRIDVDLLDQDDNAYLPYAAVPLFVDGGLGADEIVGGTAPDHVNGGPGADKLFAGSGDQLDGGPGPDSLGVGPDASGATLSGDGDDDLLQALAPLVSFSGGAGTDRYVFGGDDDATITLDDRADDGAGAVLTANVHSDVEDVTTSRGDDRIVGSPAANLLDGGGGADAIDGAAGADTLVAGSGDDVVQARDGTADAIECGPGNDRVVADALDSTTDCERVLLDRDGDAADSDVDCNDDAAAIHPGAIEIPEDGIDQDCDGADLIDPDRDDDGYARPVDCDDADPLIHPGAAEIRGNQTDEDCDGVPLGFPRITSAVPYRFKLVRHHATEVLRLAIRDAPVGALIRVRCRGGGCPRRIRPVISKGLKEVALTTRFRRPLRAGAVIVVTITADGWIGKRLTFVMRARKPPRPPAIRCLPPGARATTCPLGT